MPDEIKVSPSTLNLLIECPRCFWLKMVKGIDRPKGMMAGIAIGIDSVLKKYCDSYREKGELPPLWKGKVPGRLAYPKPRALKWLDSATGLLLKGVLDDCIEIRKGIFAPLDHKTKASEPREIYPSYQVQMDIYTFLLEKNSMPTENKAFIVYYYPKRGEVEKGLMFDTTVVELRTNPDATIPLLKQARELLGKTSPPAHGKTCEFCNWKGR